MRCPRCKHENDLQGDFCARCGFSFSQTRAMGESSEVLTTSLVGRVINGKYRVLSVLGEGGFGIVYKVELLLFDMSNIFALKLLHPSLSQDRMFRRRFLREAGLAMALIHENTIQIREFGQTEDGQLFFTMDYCEGEPLKSVIQRERFLTVNRALHVARQILSVMRLAHARGIVHRDIKPENIFLEKDAHGQDFVKVGDFGLAKSFCPVDGPAFSPGAAARHGSPPRDDITRGGVVGTPRYMSPEQAQGRDDIDDRADLYSIGVVLYEMLYGQVPPERRRTDGGAARLDTPPNGSPHPVPRAVWEVVRRGAEVDREKRFQNAVEFLAAIDALPQYTPTYLEPIARPRSRARLLGPVLTLLVLAAVIALGLYAGGWPWKAQDDSAGNPASVLDDGSVGSGGSGVGDSPSTKREIEEQRLVPLEPSQDLKTPDPAASPTRDASSGDGGTGSGSAEASVAARSTGPTLADPSSTGSSAAAIPIGPSTAVPSAVVPSAVVPSAVVPSAVVPSAVGGGASAASSPPPLGRRTSWLSPPPEKGIRTFVSVSVGDTLTYWSFREGWVPDREITYTVQEQPQPGRFTVRVSPGDRTLSWIVDEKANAFYQEYSLPDLKTGELTRVERRLRLRLPQPTAVVDGDYIEAEGDLKVHARPVDLRVPPQLGYGVIRQCLCVESREGNRIHCEYYQQGRGLVARVVYEPRPIASSEVARPATDKAGSALEATAALPLPEHLPSIPGADEAGAVPTRYVVVYARYLLLPGK